MSDQTHPAAVRIQSSAMVAAALITTLGAVIAACIQTGIISKTPTVNVSDFVPSAAPSGGGIGSTWSESFDRLSMVQPMHKAFVPAVQNNLRPAPRVASASFVGTIEPTSDQRATNSGSENSIPATNSQLTVPQPWTQGNRLEPVRPTSFTPNGAANTPAILQTALVETKQTVGYAPALLPQETPVKILPSPWAFLGSSTPGDVAASGSKLTSDTKLASVDRLPSADNKPVDATKVAKKSLDWGTVARLWPWHN